MTSILICLLSAGLSAIVRDVRLPEAIPVRYGTEATVELSVGLWGIPLPTDYDGDGRNDLLVSCPDKPYKGIYFFRNIGTGSAPLFDKAVKVFEKAPNNIRVSYFGGEPRVLAKDKEYPGFFSGDFTGKPSPVRYEGERIGAMIKRSRSNMWNYTDWDADGDADILVGIDSWDDYGWDNAYDADGNWTHGPLHGYVYLLENEDGTYVNKGKVEAGGRVIDTFGAPCPCVADFDGDGLQDLICGEFLDGLTWFKNTGSPGKPAFSEGRRLSNRKGEIRFHIEMIVPVPFDFDGDSHMDLVVGDEDGTIYWVRNTGRTWKGMPLFEDPVPFRQKADLVKFGALATPCSFDWDGDGEEDIITGNSAGEIALIRNLGNGKWDTPTLFTVKGKPFRIMAGENGSIQGPAERKWGYTVLSVADWDGDGRADIIFNSIWGKVQWMKGLRGTRLSAPKDVTVAWAGETPKVKWNWWSPAEGTLATQWRTTPVAIDWNKDGLCDLISLDQEGWLSYYERRGDGRLNPGKRIFHGSDGSVYNNRKGITDTTPGPLRLNDLEAGESGRRKICFADWDHDGHPDLIADGPSAVWWQGEPSESGRYMLTYKGDLSRTVLEGHTTCPTPVDWDHDGIIDLLLGAEDGHFYLIRNTERQSLCSFK